MKRLCFFRAFCLSVGMLFAVCATVSSAWPQAKESTPKSAFRLSQTNATSTLGAHTLSNGLVKIDMTDMRGMRLQRTPQGLRAEVLDGAKNDPGPFDIKSIRIISRHVGIWSLSDAVGHSMQITDKVKQPVIVINRTETPISLTSHGGSPALPISILPHALIILNRVLYPLTVNGSSQGGTYQIFIPKTKLPLTIIRTTPPQMNETKFGDGKTVTDFG